MYNVPFTTEKNNDQIWVIIIYSGHFKVNGLRLYFKGPIDTL